MGSQLSFYSISMFSPSAVMSVIMSSWYSLRYLSQLSLVMPFSGLSIMLGGHIQSRLELFQYPYLHSCGMDQAHLPCHLSGAFAGILDFCHMLCELIVWDYGMRSMVLHWMWFLLLPSEHSLIHLKVCLPSLDFVHLLLFPESNSRLICSYTCRCWPAQLVNISHGASFLHFQFSKGGDSSFIIPLSR